MSFVIFVAKNIPRDRPIGHWQHWNWQHFHIGNILTAPKKLFRAQPCAALWDLVHYFHTPHRVNLLRRVILSVRILFFRGFDDMQSKPKLPLPNGYTRKYETEDVLVRKLVSRGLDAPNKDVLRNVLRIVGYYRLTGYLYPFRKPGSDDYEQGTSLDKVWRLYSFDRRLRLIVTDALARIEVAVRARVMECHSLAFGGSPFAYCDPAAMPSLKQTQFDEFEGFVDKAILQAKLLRTRQRSGQ